MRAIVLLAIAAAVVVTPQARSGGANALAPECSFVEPTAEKLASLEPARAAAERRSPRRCGVPTRAATAVGDRRLWPALDPVNKPSNT